MIALALSVWLLHAAPAPASLFQQGKTAFVEGRIADALSLFEQANTQSPSAELLINIAQCHRLLGHRADAMAALEQFLKAAPESHKLRKAVEGTLAELKAEAAKDAPADVPRKVELEPAPVQPAPEVEAAPKAAGMPAWPFIAGAVVVVVAAGVAVAIAVASQPPSLGRVQVPAK